MLSINEPLAFMSYLHFNDVADDGAITRLRHDLSIQIQVQTGEVFSIFQDRSGINLGEIWKARIDKELKSATFFIPIITPGYFKSRHCRSELDAFLKYEEQMARKDLILPLRYVSPDFADEDACPYEHLLERQHVDWTDMRFSDNDCERRRRLTDLALQVKAAIDRTLSYQRNRAPNEPFFQPRRLETGKENEPFDQGLGIIDGLVDDRDKDPRSLLNNAVHNKQKGKYEEAKRLHDELTALPVNWDECADLFVDHTYFSISLHDKLEGWQELDWLDRHFFKPNFAKLRSIVSALAFDSMRTMYQASMALCMLRQMRLEDALKRIERAMSNPPVSDDGPTSQILYANALVARALIYHAMYVYGQDTSELLANADADLNTAEAIYGNYAKMGQADEFHHVGRYYGTRAFLLIAMSRAKGEKLAHVAETLVDLGWQAHRGKNRTGYGCISGKYCHAYCLYKLALEEPKEEVRVARFTQAYQLLCEALSAFDEPVSLGRYKVARLSKLVLRSIGGDTRADNIALVQERANARKRLQKKGFLQLKQIDQSKWLKTPLN